MNGSTVLNDIKEKHKELIKEFPILEGKVEAIAMAIEYSKTEFITGELTEITDKIENLDKLQL